MRIDIFPTANSIIPEELVGHTTIVFDVLRATSTIVTALANGCRAIIPAVEVKEAEQLARKLADNGDPSLGKINKSDILVGGERGGQKIPTFLYGNSPLEYVPEVVKDKILVLTTTNGTRAIRLAARKADLLLIGSLLNISAVAREAHRIKRDIALVCAGTEGNFSLEDTLTAGIFIREVMALESGGVFLSDLGRIAYLVAGFYQYDLVQPLYNSQHGQKLLRLGREEDLHYCARLNIFNLIPLYQEGIIQPY